MLPYVFGGLGALLFVGGVVWAVLAAMGRPKVAAENVRVVHSGSSVPILGPDEVTRPSGVITSHTAYAHLLELQGYFEANGSEAGAQAIAEAGQALFPSKVRNTVK